MSYVLAWMHSVCLCWGTRAYTHAPTYEKYTRHIHMPHSHKVTAHVHHNFWLHVAYVG
jgi:hypothetical protein